MENHQTRQTPKSKQALAATQAGMVSDVHGDSGEKRRMCGSLPLKQRQGSDGGADALSSSAEYEPDQEHERAHEEEPFALPGVLPILPLQDTVVYPFIVRPLAIGQERDMRLIDDVMRADRLVVLVAQKSADRELAGPGDIFTTGTVARIVRMLPMPDGTIQLVVQGLARVAIGE